MSGQCPHCAARQTDTLLCRTCLAHITEALNVVMPAADPHLAAVPPTQAHLAGHPGTLPWERPRRSWAGLDIELIVTLTRNSRGAPNLAAGRTATTPLLYDTAASDTTEHLRGVLAAWVLNLHNLTEPWPADTITDLADWLLTRMERLRQVADPCLLYTDIVGAVGQAMRVIDPHPGARLDHTVDIPPEVLATALLTRHEMCDLFEGLGAHRFANWVRRGKLTPHATDRTGHALYRAGDVRELLRPKQVTPHHQR